jgi:hypothetical protein
MHQSRGATFATRRLVKNIFISHAFSSAPGENAAAVTRLARRLTLSQVLPIAPQIYLPQFIDEATERDLALRLCLALVSLSDEVRVYGEPTAGMRLEIAEARRLGIPVIAGDVEGEKTLTGEPPPMLTRGRLRGEST